MRIYFILYFYTAFTTNLQTMIYPQSSIERTNVPADKKPWKVDFEG